LQDCGGTAPHIADVPERIRLGEASGSWIKVPGSKIVRIGLKVKILTGEAEGVGVAGVLVQFHAEGVVVVGVQNRALRGDSLHNVSAGVEDIVPVVVASYQPSAAGSVESVYDRS